MKRLYFFSEELIRRTISSDKSWPKFSRHAWSVVSYPYIGCCGILEATQEDPVNANNLTIQTIKERLHLDDLLFSMDTLEEAQTVATKSIDLLSSRSY